MAIQENPDTRYFLDVDVRTRRILRRGFADRHLLRGEESGRAGVHRVFVTRGQYRKLDRIFSAEKKRASRALERMSGRSSR